MKVRLRTIENPDRFYAFFLNTDSLEKNKIYEVIEIHNQYYRIEDELREPVLYDKRLFEIVDATIPKGYIYQFIYQEDEEVHEDEDGWLSKGCTEEYVITPACFSQTTFFDLYFDGKEEQVKIYNEYRKLLKGDDS